MPNRFLLQENGGGYILQQDGGHIIVDHDPDINIFVGSADTVPILLQYQSAGPLQLTDGGMRVSVEYTVPVPVGIVFSQALGAGNNDINIPVGDPVTVIIVPPPHNTATMFLKGAVSDIGIMLNQTAPTFLSIASVMTSFIINSDIPVTLNFTWI